MRARIHRALLRLFRRLPVRTRRLVVRWLSPSYTVGSICFIERADGALLLVRQSYRRGWGAPGGLLERGETPADAARREVLEEVGLDVELVGEPAVIVTPTPQRVDVVYRARLAESDIAEPVPSSPEIDEAAWFRPDELPDLQFETAQALVALARSARSPQARPMQPGVGLAPRHSDAV